MKISYVKRIIKKASKTNKPLAFQYNGLNYEMEYSSSNSFQLYINEVGRNDVLGVVSGYNEIGNLSIDGKPFFEVCKDFDFFYFS